MPVKTMLMLKRKAGMTPEDFRHRYETGHSRLGKKIFGHLWHEYRRNYMGPANSFAAAAGTPDADGSAEAAGPYDVITEIIYKDMAAFKEMNRIAAQPDVNKVLADDEETLFDRKNCWVSVVECLEEDLSDVEQK